MQLKKTESGKVRTIYENSKDRIAGYLAGELEEHELKGNEVEMMRRWLEVFTLLGNYNSPMQAVNAHVKKQEILGKPISMRTAWNDYQNAVNTWGSLAKTTVDAKLIMAEEYIMKTFRLAAEFRDVKGMNSALKNLLEIIKMRKLDPNAPDFSKIQPTNIYLNLISPDGKKSLNITDLGKLKTKDYEEVIEFIEDNEISTEDVHAIILEEENAGESDTEL